ncbi:autotransporter assembly complex family protein [Roseibium sp. H3510]|uniref:Autotransporter assembly complex family protein n=2 Tax=Roseibium algae TaxID=3123038 RepID=A0ABU8TPN8_9HYPH
MTLFGEKEVQSDPAPDPLAYTASLTVSGEDDLTAGLEASSLLITREKQRPSGRSGLISRGLTDLDRLVARLYTTGHYGGTVKIDFNGTSLQTALETGDIPGARPVKVAINVTPGPQFTFGRININAAGKAGASLSEDPGSWGLSSGLPAKSGDILVAEGRIVKTLRARGYPNAKITNREIVADHATNKLDVSLDVNTGFKARFGAVTVSGADITDPAFVARQAMIPEGTVYSPAELDKARGRLNELGIFSSVRLIEGDVSGPDGLLPIMIEVSERKRHVIGAGATWSSSEGFGVEGYWRRRNVFGKGELLSLEGSVGRIGNADLQAMEYSTRIAFEKPGVFGPTTKFTTSLGAKQEAPDAYTSRSVTLDAYLVHDFNEHLTGRGGAKVYYSQEDDVFGENEYLLVSLPADLTFDNRDNKLNPSKGIFAAASLEPAYDTLNSNAMVFIKATVSSYVALDEAKRFILAGKIAGGSILGPSIEDIPASQRFIAGGGGSIRGYAYRNVGPRKNGQVTGGRSLLEVSGEIRVRMTDTIGMVGFVDAGNAYADSTPDLSKPLKIGVGAGIRYFTPIGPLRIDAAVPLDPEKDDPEFALYVGLSQAF